MLVNHGGTATQPRAPGHERPHAALRAARHGRLSAASTAPGADIPRATTARAPGQYCLSAAPRAPGHGRPLAIAAEAPCRDRLSAAPIATVALPAGQHRLRQEGLPRISANPRILPHSPAHQDTAHTRTVYRRATRYAQSRPRPTARHHAGSPSLAGKGPGVSSTFHQVHPAIQVPPYPRSCSTACTGFIHQHPAQAHAQKTYPCQQLGVPRP